MNRLILGAFAILISMGALAGGGAQVKLQKATIDDKDKASLQRGAKYFINFCQQCHSLKYVRYNQLARDIGVVDDNGKVDAQLVSSSMIFTGVQLTDMMLTALPAEDSAEWFGVKPPDLSLITRVRGADWVYTYLLSFYTDANRPWGTNNLVFPDVAMPNVLEAYQGKQGLEHGHLSHKTTGIMGEPEFKAMVNDITNFLSFVAQPHQDFQFKLGIYVLIFLTILLVFAYYLKVEYWKRVK